MRTKSWVQSFPRAFENSLKVIMSLLYLYVLFYLFRLLIRPMEDGYGSICEKTVQDVQ